MSRAVWKYVLHDYGEPNVFEMPPGAEVLSAGHQPDGAGGFRICVWALVDPDAVERVRRFFIIAGTGHREVPDTGVRHVGRVTIDRSDVGAGFYEFHVFEVST